MGSVIDMVFGVTLASIFDDFVRAGGLLIRRCAVTGRVSYVSD